MPGSVRHQRARLLTERELRATRNLATIGRLAVRGRTRDRGRAIARKSPGEHGGNLTLGLPRERGASCRIVLPATQVIVEPVSGG